MFAELLLAYLLLSLSYLFTLLVARAEGAETSDFADEHEFLKRVLSRWIEYFEILSRALRLHDNDVVNAAAWLSTLAALSYLVVMIGYGA